MRGLGDVSRTHDAASRRASFNHEIVHQDQPLEMALESAPDFSHSEMCAARGPFFGMRFGHIVSLAFLNSSRVAAFRRPNSDSRNRVCFAASRQARKIIAPGARHRPTNRTKFQDAHHWNTDAESEEVTLDPWKSNSTLRTATLCVTSSAQSRVTLCNRIDKAQAEIVFDASLVYTPLNIAWPGVYVFRRTMPRPENRCRVASR